MEEFARKLLAVGELVDRRWEPGGLHMSNLIHIASMELCEDSAMSALIAILLNAAWNDSLAWAIDEFEYEFWNMSGELL